MIRRRTKKGWFQPVPLFKKQDRDSIIGKSDFRIARARAYDCGMIFTGLDSLLEDVRQLLQVGRRVMMDERWDVAPGVSLVEHAGAAGVTRVVHQLQPE